MMKTIAVILFSLVSIVSAKGSIELIDANSGDLLAGDLISFLWLEDGEYVGNFTNFRIDVEAGEYVEGILTYRGNTGILDPWKIKEEGDGFIIEGGVFYIYVNVPADNVIMQFYFNAPEVPGCYAIDISGEYGGEDASYLSTEFCVVPEPVTLGLFVVGGLFLRSGKK